MRDRVRLNLRTAGVRMIHLGMEVEEDIRTRLTRRHVDAVEILMVSLIFITRKEKIFFHNLSSQTVARHCEVEEEEEEGGVVTVRITNKMTEHQVMETILQRYSGVGSK